MKTRPRRMFNPPPLQRTLAAALRDLRSSKAEVRASAARDLAIAGRDDPSNSAAALVPLLEDAAPAVRGEAALALGALGAGPHAEALERLLDDANSAVRQNAVIALGQAEGAAAVAALERAFADHAHADVRYQALLALAGSDPARGFELALTALTDDDVWIAAEAATQLGALLTAERDADEHGGNGDRDAAPWSTEGHRARAREALRARLEDTVGRVALASAIALARLGDDRGRATIVGFLAGRHPIEPGDDAHDLRHEAITVLGELGDAGDGAREVLAQLAWRMLPSLERDLARASLAALGDARAADAIVAQLGSIWGAQRHAAVQLAASGRVRAAVPALRGMLASGRVDPYVVVRALGLIGDPSARDALEPLAARDDDPEIARAARAALARIARAAAART